MRRSRRAMLLGSLAVLILGAVGLRLTLFRPHLPPAERGRRLAEGMGCFSCHGPEGTRGAPNPGRPHPWIPTFEGDLMMFAEGPEDIRAWIRDGVTSDRAESESWRKERDAGAVRMPAFGDRLSPRQLEDLVAFVLASAGLPAPPDSLARTGQDRAAALGCFGCHGRGGRFSRPNPGSLKGYIPSWDGADFPELVRNRAEFEEWTRKGVSKRFARDPFARYFLRRAALQMPPFEAHLEPGDVEALWAYVTWLRDSGSRPPAQLTGAP